MKPLHWTRLLVATTKKKTIWEGIDDATFDIDSFVDAFAVTPTIRKAKSEFFNEKGSSDRREPGKNYLLFIFN